MAADSLWANVVLLAHLNDLADSSSTGKTITASGNAVISSAQAQFGGSSALFDGTGDYLDLGSHADFSFGSGDFCVEAFVYPTSIASPRGIFSVGGGNSTTGFSFYIQGSTGKLVFRQGGNDRITGTTTISTNTWTHVVVTRESGTVRLYVNGVANGTYGTAITLSDTSAAIGTDAANKDTSTTNKFLGHIDEVRVTKGFCRYTAASAPFSPPSTNYLEAGQLIGTTKDAAGSGISAALRAYLTSSGALKYTATSAGDGSFTINTNTTSAYDIVCDFGSSENKQIYSSVIPV